MLLFRNFNFLLFSLLFSVCLAEYRFGSLTWRQIGPTTVRFQLTLSVHNVSPLPNVGDSYPISDLFVTGDGNQIDLTPIVTQIVNHTVYGSFFCIGINFPYGYALPTIYTAYFRPCCRLASLQNNANLPLRLETTVDLHVFYPWQEVPDTYLRASPMTSSLPMVPLYITAGQATPATFVLSASERNDETIHWRLATFIEMTGGSVGTLQPLGLTVTDFPSVSGGGLITWTNASNYTAGLYSVQLIVENSYSKTPVDFLIDLRVAVKRCDLSCTNVGTVCTLATDCTGCGASKCVTNSAPIFQGLTREAGSMKVISPCGSTPFSVEMIDYGSAYTDAVTLELSSTPFGMTLTSDTLYNPRQMRYMWSPTLQDEGLYTLCIAAWDKYGVATAPVCNHFKVLPLMCNGHGLCTDGNTCVCEGRWVGLSCEQCSMGWFGEDCSQKYGGPVYATGDNSVGESGLGSATTSVSLPTKVNGSLYGLNVIRFSAGAYHSVVQTDEGRIFTFGSNLLGQLGMAVDANNVTILNSSVPLEITYYTGPRPLLSLSAGCYHTVALTDTYRVLVWGSNAYGQLGVNQSYVNGSMFYPYDVTAAFPEQIVSIVAGCNFTYAITNSSRIYAFGRNDKGQLATGTTVDKFNPTDVTSAFPEPISKIAAGQDFVLALSQTGRVYSVGANNYGQLGLNSVSASVTTPTIIDRTYYGSLTVTDIFAGDAHSLLQTNTTSVYVFGCNDQGQLGIGNTTSYSHPVPLPALRINPLYLDAIPSRFALGVNATYILTTRHVLYAFGQNDKGQLGLNISNATVSTPTQIANSFNYGIVQDVTAGRGFALLMVQNENFDPGRTKMRCFPTVAGLATRCVIELFDARGYPYGDADQISNFRILTIKGGDGNDICPPPSDIPTFLDRGRFYYTWISPSLGRGGRFSVAFRGEALIVQNNTHNNRFNYFSEIIPGYDFQQPWKTPEYMEAVLSRVPIASDTELFLFFKPATTYDPNWGVDLVKNGSAELGLTGWTVNPVTAVWTQRSTNPPAIFDNYYFSLVSAYGELSQTVDLTSYASTIDTGKQLFMFQCFVRTLADAYMDTAQVKVEYMTSVSAVLSTFDTGLRTFVANLSDWETVMDNRVVPISTRKARITLIAQHLGAAQPYTHAFFDHVSLRAGAMVSIPDSQRQALIELYNATNGSGWFNNMNWLQGDPCKSFWQGITCVYHSVTQIELAHNNLRGTLPASIGAFPNLLVLDLSSNELTGTVPTNVTQLLQLKRLNLWNNSLTSLPDSLAQLTCLLKLQAGTNKLTSIPATIGQMWRMLYADFSFNQIAAPIPALPNLPRLTTLLLHNNAIPGTIPTSIGLTVPSLHMVDFSHNLLTGTIPLSFANATGLFLLQLNHNQLQGTIPSTLSTLPTLSTLTIHLHHNSLTGVIPTFIQWVRHAYLSFNNWTCPVPLYPTIYDAQYVVCREYDIRASPQRLSFEGAR